MFCIHINLDTRDTFQIKRTEWNIRENNISIVPKCDFSICLILYRTLDRSNIIGEDKEEGTKTN